MMKFIVRHIVLYHRSYVVGVDERGCVKYGLEDQLRASLFGVRIPVLWALDQLALAGILKFQAFDHASAGMTSGATW